MFFFFNQKYCSRTQVASSSPSPKGRGVICVIPLVISKCLRSLLLNYLSKLYYSSELFPALPLSLRRGGRGVRFFLVQRKREDVKSSFTSSLLGYILFSVPYCQLLTTCISTRILLYLPPPCMGGGVRATFYITVLHRLDECCAYYSC